MNTEKMITDIRNYVIANTSITKIYSPELPQDDSENICAITMLGGNPLNSLCGALINYFTIRIIIRGSTNDTTTRELTDEIYNSLNNIKIGDYIIQASTVPIYVGKDESMKILYNITFRIKEV